MSDPVTINGDAGVDCELFPGAQECDQPLVDPEAEPQVDDDMEGDYESDHGDDHDHASDYDDYDEDEWERMRQWEEEELDEYNGKGGRGGKMGFYADLFMLSLAVGKSVFFSLQLFRYTSIDNYFNAGEISGGTNWWKYAIQVLNWFGFSLWSLMAFTQLLSLFMEMGYVNLVVWYYGIQLLMAGSMTYSLFIFLAFDEAYEVRANKRDKYTSFQISAATDLQRDIEIQVAKTTVIDLGTFLYMAVAAQPWMKSQLGGYESEDEDKPKKKGKKGAKKGAKKGGKKEEDESDWSEGDFTEDWDE